MALAGPLALGLLANCDRERERPSLLGRWVGDGPRSEGSTFEFRGDGTATWWLPAGEFELEYRADYGDTPIALDIRGFEEGPLAGRVLQCIVRFEGDTRLWVDCEPGEPGSDEDRPASFDSEETWTYARSEEEP